jgi:carboxyl-terminal processing protease
MNQGKKKYILFILVTLILFGVTLITTNKFFFTGNFLFSSTNSTNTDSPIDPEEENYFKYSRMFSETYHILKREFYDRRRVTARKLFYGAIRGMLESLNDPYTTFMDPSVTKEFKVDMDAKFGGLGIRIDVRDGWLTVISPMENTPAWRVGLKPNDKIIEIEGKSTKGITTEEAVTILRGAPGTKVTITIARESMEPFEVTITREEITIQTVRSDIIQYQNKKIAYIRISEFSMPTADDFAKHLRDMLNKNPDGIIIDLRHNPGGLLSVVINCVDDFLEEGLIVYTRGRLQENNADYYANKRNTIVPADLPLVVMINQGSASASEIFSGAMKDTGRGVVIGMKSFGKGSVQKTYSFVEDGSLIKYTVANYYTPSGAVIERKGVEPDIEVKNWIEELSEKERVSLFKVQNTNFVSEFVKDKKMPSDTMLSRFQKELSDKGYELPISAVRWLVINKIREAEMPKLYDLEFDNQLSKSLTVITDYDKYKKTLRYYNAAKN